jgi:hypothetical protein
VHPNAVRREANRPAESVEPPGVFIQHNPTVSVVWTTLRFKLLRADGGVLFSMGDPESVQWFTHGRNATRAEALSALEKGLPVLREIAEAEDAHNELQRAIDEVLPLLPD